MNVHSSPAHSPQKVEAAPASISRWSEMCVQPHSGMSVIQVWKGLKYRHLPPRVWTPQTSHSMKEARHKRSPVAWCCLYETSTGQANPWREYRSEVAGVEAGQGVTANGFWLPRGCQGCSGKRGDDGHTTPLKVLEPPNCTLWFLYIYISIPLWFVTGYQI